MPGVFWVSVISYLLALGCAFIEAIIPTGVFWERMMMFLYFAFTIAGVIAAGILNDPDKNWEYTISDEEYEKLYNMILERKKQLNGGNA